MQHSESYNCGRMKRVVIVGGGVAGLAVAYRLRGRAAVTILEPNEPGGTIRTVREKGFLIEGGPDSFVTAKPEGIQLCRELGLGEDLIPPSVRKVYVFSRGSLHELPEGMFLTVPTRIAPMVWTRLISWPGKVRMGLDLVLPRGGGGDESLGSFVRRRFGQEALSKIAEPLMAGIFVAEADRLSLRSTFPRFADLEARHRSLIRAMRSTPPSGQSPLVTLRSGLSSLVERLCTGIDATWVRSAAARVDPGYRVVHAAGAVEGDAVVLATPPPVAAGLLSRWTEAAELVGRIRCATTATVSLGYRSGDVPRPLDGTGFVMPREERRGILACTWSSSKFVGRAPEGFALLRCFLEGRMSNPAEVARQELRRILGIAAEPVVSRAFEWPEANPIYEVGHGERIAAIERSLPAGLLVTGAGYRGIGIPGCIADASRITNRLGL